MWSSRVTRALHLSFMVPARLRWGASGTLRCSEPSTLDTRLAFGGKAL